MVKNNVYYEWFASITVPNPDQVGYWVDLGADSKGRIIKVYNRDIEKWVVLFDVSKDDYVPPFIGSNGNWWVDNRDTGVKATAETPYIGENDHWFTYDPINKVYVDTGIEARGLSAYDIAVKLGFEGSEQDWIDSLSKASEDAAVAALDAAAEALDAKAQVEATEQAVKEAEALRVTAEQGRVNAENTRVSNENTRISNEDSRKAEESKRVTAENERIAAENSRKSEEDIRKTNEANRISAESSRASAETLRASAEVERNTNEQKRIEEETKRISSEEGRVAAETKRVDNEDARIAAETARDTAEQERESNEATRQANEAIRETQEAAREKNTADAITAVNEAKTAAQQATTNATTAANNANTQANRAKEYADNPPKVGEDGYWYLWDEVNDVYVNTGWPSSGIILKGSLDSPEDLNDIVDPQLSDSYIVGTDLYFWNGTEWVNMGRFQGPQGEPGKDAELSKAAIEAVLVGEVTTHTHDTRYYTKDQADARFVQKEEGKGLSTNDYTNADKTKVTNLTDYVTGGTGAVTNANAATITLSKKNPVNGSASTDTVVINKATTTTAGVMSAADKTKLDGLSNYDDSTITQDITNIKANKLETIEVTGTGNVITTVTKNGTKIAFAKGITAMTQDTSDARYVKKTGDTMSGRLNIKTPASTGFTLRLAKETSDTPENDEIFVRMDIDDNNKGSFGYHNTHGTSMYNYGSSSRFHIANDGELKYLTNGVDGKVWHAGNDGSGSGLDADLLDGYHAGYKNGDLALYINLPKITDLISQGLLRSDYETVGYPTEDFLIALCKWAINNYIGETSHVLLQGEITPAVSGWCVLNLYANDGKDNTTGLPKYCSGQVNLINKSSILFGSYNGTWYYKTLVDTSNLEDTLAYWYENDENNSSTTCATGGNRNVIESLRSKFKRCIAKPYGDDAALISYCNEENSANWPDGSGIDIVFARKENRMVHFPKYYHKTVERSPGIWRTYISEQQIDSDYIEEPEMLLGTFEAYTNTDGTLLSAWGVASTASQTMVTFVSQAKSNGPLWSIGDYRSHATIARMFCAYYKTTNISTSNSAIPCSGGTKRYNYGITGATITLGNRDGKKATTSDTSYYSTNFLGLEDCYYSKWEFVQGINLLKGKCVVYDGGSFPDKDVAELEAAGATNIRVVGYGPNPAATEAYNGWTKAVAQGKYGDVIPTAHGGSETTYYSDYSWFNPTGNRIFLRSGSSGNGSPCGVFLAAASYASSTSWADLGARLAFYGKIVVVDSDTFKKMQA